MHFIVFYTCWSNTYIKRPCLQSFRCSPSYFPLTQSGGGGASDMFVQAASLTFESHCVISITAQLASPTLSAGHARG